MEDVIDYQTRLGSEPSFLYPDRRQALCQKWLAPADPGLVVDSVTIRAS
jgi:hypothetical protein